MNILVAMHEIFIYSFVHKINFILIQLNTLFSIFMATYICQYYPIYLTYSMKKIFRKTKVMIINKITVKPGLHTIDSTLLF